MTPSAFSRTAAALLLALATLSAQVTETSRALAFDGSDDFVVVAANPALEFTASSPFTVELWVRMDAAPAPGTQMSLVEKWNGSCAVPYPFTVRVTETGEVRCASYTALSCSTADGLVTSNGLSIVDGKWHHLAYVRDLGGISRLFVDGEERGVSFQPPLATLANGQPLYLGRRGPGGPFANHFAGELDEFRLSAVARYGAPFAPETRFSPDADTLLLYHADQVSGEFVLDAGPLGLDGLTGGTVVPTPEDPMRIDSTLPGPLVGLQSAVGAGAFDGSFKIAPGGSTLSLRLDAVELPAFAGQPATIAMNLGSDAFTAASTPGIFGFEAVHGLSAPAGVAFFLGNGGVAEALGLGLGFDLSALGVGGAPIVIALPFAPGAVVPLRFQALYIAPEVSAAPIGATNAVSAEFQG